MGLIRYLPGCRRDLPLASRQRFTSSASVACVGIFCPPPLALSLSCPCQDADQPAVGPVPCMDHSAEQPLLPVSGIARMHCLPAAPWHALPQASSQTEPPSGCANGRPLLVKAFVARGNLSLASQKSFGVVSAFAPCRDELGPSMWSHDF